MSVATGEGGAGDGDSFVGRWARRKRAAVDDPAVDDPIVAGPTVGTSTGTTGPDAPHADAPRAAPGETDAGGTGADAPPPLTDADMPPLDGLDGRSDVSAFMSRGVSSALRQAALRRVFRSPEFNVRDGLNDYDGDFTKFEPLGDTITCDVRFHAARREREREAAEREARELVESRDARHEDERDGMHGEGQGEGGPGERVAPETEPEAASAAAADDPVGPDDVEGGSDEARSGATDPVDGGVRARPDEAPPA